MEHKTTHEEKQRQSEEAPLKVGWDVIHLSDLGISLRHRDGFPNTFLAKVFPLVLSQTRILSLLGRIKGFGILHYLKQKTCDKGRLPKKQTGKCGNFEKTGGDFHPIHYLLQITTTWPDQCNTAVSLSLFPDILVWTCEFVCYHLWYAVGRGFEIAKFGVIFPISM